MRSSLCLAILLPLCRANEPTQILSADEHGNDAVFSPADLAADQPPTFLQQPQPALWPLFNASTAIKPQPPDADLRALLAAIDPARIRAAVDKLASFGTRHTMSSQTDPERGIGAARAWIEAELRAHAARSQGRMAVSVSSHVQEAKGRVRAPTAVHNVLARVAGAAEPDRVYVVVAHYDSVASDPFDAVSDAPGANDDASGVAVVLELARALAAHPAAARATLLLAAVPGEEQGLFGSAFLARDLKNQSARVEGVLSNDIVGSPRGADGRHSPGVVRVFAQGLPSNLPAAQLQAALRLGVENDTPARQLARFVREVSANDAAAMDAQIVYRTDRYGRGGDHQSFLAQGYPAVRLTEPHENYAHQHQNVRVQDGAQLGDLPQFVDPEYVARVARVNLAAAWSLANSPGKVPHVRLDPSGMVNWSRLTWGRARSREVRGYEIVWRPTTSAVWTNALAVGDVAMRIVDVSKDNVIFGVRAVGRNGYKGPVTAAGSI
jgi:hypothetical protein